MVKLNIEPIKDKQGALAIRVTDGAKVLWHLSATPVMKAGNDGVQKPEIVIESFDTEKPMLTVVK